MDGTSNAGSTGAPENRRLLNKDMDARKEREGDRWLDLCGAYAMRWTGAVLTGRDLSEILWRSRMNVVDVTLRVEDSDTTDVVEEGEWMSE